jgi:alcohol dehydrogenase
MNEEFGIPSGLEALKKSDIPKIAGNALKEAHYTYAVPRYMDQAACEALISKMLV